MAGRMTTGQRKTVKVLGIWTALQVLEALGVLAWEFYSAALPDHATITETVQLLYAHQQWPFLLVAVLVTGVVAFLGAHFFAAPSKVYDELRREKSL